MTLDLSNLKRPSIEWCGVTFAGWRFWVVLAPFVVMMFVVGWSARAYRLVKRDWPSWYRVRVSKGGKTVLYQGGRRR